MTKNRLEAFSDGVLAIIITIMVLELKVPHGSTWQDLYNLAPVFYSYVISFIYIAIYWNNHHHLLHAVKMVNGPVLWANTHLLFWLSLFPFVTAWSGENHFTENPVSLYGLVLLMAGVAYYILSKTLITLHGKDSVIAKALGKDFKGKISVVIYAGAIIIAQWWPIAAVIIYALVALMWLVPDKRIEKALKN